MDDNDLSKSQVFVRNLPFDATSEDLATIFQDIGPIRRTSIATEGEKSKGFGFVKFALEEDAQKAIDEMQNFVFKGRKLKLEKAVKPHHNKKEEKDETKKEEKKIQHKRETTNEKEKEKPVSIIDKVNQEVDANTSRSLKLIAFGIPKTIKKKDFKKVTSKIVRKAEITAVGEDHSLFPVINNIAPAGKVFMLVIPSRKYIPKLTEFFSTCTANTFLQATVSKSKDKKEKKSDDNEEEEEEEDDEAKEDLQVNKIEDAKKINNGSKVFLRSLSDITEEAHRRKKCRLIIRNLSFQASEEHVMDKLSQFGPITEVSIPRIEITKTEVPHNYKRKSMNENEEGNESSNQNLKSKTKLQPRGFGFVTFLCEKDARDAVEKCAGLRICNREVAVDFCASKEMHNRMLANASTAATATATGDENETKKDSKDSSSLNKDMETNKDEEDDDDDDDDDEDDDDEGDEGDEEVESSDEEEEEDKDEKLKREVKEKSNDASEERTVFLRELAFDAGERDIRAALARFGRIELAILVKDKLSGESKGSAFVKFSNREEARECVQAMSIRGAILIKDRECRADLALDRDKLKKVTEIRKGIKAVDKRNLYLANEGLVTENKDKKDKKSKKDTSGLSATDIAKRQKAQMDKRKKLTNPLFFVSGNRLSIRNLPKTMADQDLKIMCLRAAKSGLTKGKVSVEDVEAQIRAQGEQVEDNLQVPAFDKYAVTSAKVMLDLEKLKNGVPQSKRFGFVEFSNHAFALACLRELSNSRNCLDYLSEAQKAILNSTAPPGSEKQADRLVVEFSVENYNKVKSKLKGKKNETSNSGQQDDNDNDDVNDDNNNEEEDQRDDENAENPRKKKNKKWPTFTKHNKRKVDVNTDEGDNMADESSENKRVKMEEKKDKMAEKKKASKSKQRLLKAKRLEVTKKRKEKKANDQTV